MPDLKVGRIEQLTHTPGPWRGARHGTDLFITGADQLQSVVCEIRQYPTHECAESYANARLIAAAPELLEALKYALREEFGWGPRARAAIQKAEGR